MNTFFKICFLLSTFTVLGCRENKKKPRQIITKSDVIAAGSLYKNRLALNPKKLACSQKNIVKYNFILKRMTACLYQFVKQVDSDLEYWKKEDYFARRMSWYYKSLYHQLFKKNYQQKIENSLFYLEQLKRETSTLLGLFYEYSSHVQNGHIDNALHILAILESIFPLPEVEAELVLEIKIKKYCIHLQKIYTKNRAPHHFEKNWVSYSTIALAGGIAAYFYSQNQEVWEKHYEEIRDTWKEYVRDLTSSTYNFIKIGIFGDPMKIHKDHPDDPNGAVYISKPPNEIGLEEEARTIESNKNWYRADQWVWAKSLRIGESLYRKRGKPSAERARNNAIEISKAIDHAFNDLQKRFGVVFLVASMYPLYSGVAVIRNHVKKIHIFNPVAYHVRKLDQILHSPHELNCQLNGLLYIHTHMLLDVLFQFPIDIAQTIYEDSHRLKDIAVSIDEKQHIIQRWYDTYTFLKI
jgi:hypothetical protein